MRMLWADPTLVISDPRTYYTRLPIRALYPQGPPRFPEESALGEHPQWGAGEVLRSEPGARRRRRARCCRPKRFQFFTAGHLILAARMRKIPLERCPGSSPRPHLICWRTWSLLWQYLTLNTDVVMGTDSSKLPPFMTLPRSFTLPCLPPRARPLCPNPYLVPLQSLLKAWLHLSLCYAVYMSRGSQPVSQSSSLCASSHTVTASSHSLSVAANGRTCSRESYAGHTCSRGCYVGRTCS